MGSLAAEVDDRTLQGTAFPVESLALAGLASASVPVLGLDRDSVASSLVGSDLVAFAVARMQVDVAAGPGPIEQDIHC